MTSQFTDLVTWRGDSYALVGVEGDGLFSLEDHGLSVVATSTANWRGCVVEYEIQADQLRVQNLRQVGLPTHERDDPLRVVGIKADEDSMGGHKFVGLDLDLAFTGRILLAREQASGLPFRHMGLPPAWRFEEVWDLRLEAGRVVEATDLSERVRQLREAILAGDAPDPSGDPDDDGWIERQFELDIERSLGPHR